MSTTSLYDQYFEKKMSATGQEYTGAISDNAAVKVMKDGRVYDLGAVFATYDAQTDTFRAGNCFFPRPATCFAKWMR